MDNFLNIIKILYLLLQLYDYKLRMRIQIVISFLNANLSKREIIFF